MCVCGGRHEGPCTFPVAKENALGHPAGQCLHAGEGPLHVGIRCGLSMGTWQHYIDERTGTRRPPEHNIAPHALRYSGNVPRHWVEPTHSFDMHSELTEARRVWDREAETRHFGTDGSCRTGPGGNRAGWEHHWGPYDPRNTWGPLLGRKQTAGRAEVWAAVRAVMDAEAAIYMTIDSMEVYNKGNQIILGRTPGGRHADLWRRDLPSRKKLRGVYWVKSHSDADEAIGRAEAGGAPCMVYNDGADAPTEWGAETHTEDWSLGYVAVAVAAYTCAYQLLPRHLQSGQSPRTQPGQGCAPRIRLIGPKQIPGLPGMIATGRSSTTTVHGPRCRHACAATHACLRC